MGWEKNNWGRWALITSDLLIFKKWESHFENKWHWVLPHTLPVAFVKIIPESFTLAHISHVPIPQHSKSPLQMTSSQTVSKHPLCSHTCCIHVHWASPQEDIWIPSTLNDLLMNIPALFNGNYAGTHVQHCHEGNGVCLHTLLMHLSK